MDHYSREFGRRMCAFADKAKRGGPWKVAQYNEKDFDNRIKPVSAMMSGIAKS